MSRLQRGCSARKRREKRPLRSAELWQANTVAGRAWRRIDQ